MNEHDSSPRGAGFDDPGHSVGPEVDDSGNPTEAAPEGAADTAPEPAPEDAGQARPPAGREMLVQLQQMIDTLATQAGPVMREVAAKAAELAAVAGEKAGPIAHRAAGMTESVGQRVAARSKEMAADLRRAREQGGPDESMETDAGEWSSDPATDSGDRA